jgi:hypothetical protein
VTSYRCDFERIGRDHYVPPLVVEADDADEIAFNVFTYAKKFLASSGFDVTVNLETGKGFIEAGRFGKFDITATEGGSGNGSS